MHKLINKFHPKIYKKLILLSIIWKIVNAAKNLREWWNIKNKEINGYNNKSF
jgi:hypothetical protein